MALGVDRVAMDLKKLNRLPDGLKSSQRSIEIQQEIAAADTQNVQFSSEIGLYYVHLGSIQSKLKNHSAAKENVQKGLKILQQYADASPQWIDLKRDLALSYQLAGEVFSDAGNGREPDKHDLDVERFAQNR